MAKKVYISRVNIIKSKKYPNGRAYVNKYGLDVNDFDSYDDYKRLNDTINEWHRRNKHIENANYFEDRGRVYENKVGLNRDDFDNYEEYRKEYNNRLAWESLPQNQGRRYEDRKRYYENKVGLNRDDFDSFEEYRKEYKKNWVKINKDKLSF